MQSSRAQQLAAVPWEKIAEKIDAARVHFLLAHPCGQSSNET